MITLVKMERMAKIASSNANVSRANAIMWTEFVTASRAGGVIFVKNRVRRIRGELIVSTSVNARIMLSAEKLMDFVFAKLVIFGISYKI